MDLLDKILTWKNNHKENKEFKENNRTLVLEEEIDRFINTILPSFLLIEYNRKNLITTMVAMRSGGEITITGTDEVLYMFNSFYNEYLKPFIKLLERKGIILTFREQEFIDLLLTKIKKHIYAKVDNEIGYHFDTITNLEDSIIKYIEVMNWNIDEIHRVDYIYFLAEKLYNTDITKQIYSVTELGRIVSEHYEIYKLENRMNNVNNKLDQSPRITIEYIDTMNGQEFEVFLVDLFTNLRYSAEITKTTGDQGVDLVLFKNNQKIAVQAKCYSSTVGNSAIQQVVGGQRYYSTDKTMVVTNNYFTNSAKELANTTGTMLWDRDKLIEMIDLIY